MRTHTPIILTISALAFLASVIALVLVWNMFGAHKEAIAEMQIEAEAVTRSDAHARKARELLEMFQTERGEARTLLVEPDTVVDFLEEIEGYGDAVGASVVINTVSVVPKSDTAASDETLLVTLAVSGAWEAVYRFLDVLSLAPYALDVERLNIEASGEGNEWVGTATIHAAKLK